VGRSSGLDVAQKKEVSAPGESNADSVVVQPVA
jgi:hypothetical protein